MEPEWRSVLGLIFTLRRHNADTAISGTVKVCINPLILLVGVRGFEPLAPASRRHRIFPNPLIFRPFDQDKTHKIHPKSRGYLPITYPKLIQGKESCSLGNAPVPGYARLLL